MDDKQITVTMQQQDGMEFLVKFADGQELLMDEPAPIGEDHGPNASRVLSAAIGNCLTASLFFCLQKARVEMGKFKTEIKTDIIRNDKGRFRVGGSHVTITADVNSEAATGRMQKCLELFEDFCVVTASVRKGIEVDVKVVDGNGQTLFESKDEV
ncbi:MAG: OsmC family protein [Candidatus Zixiibacteriota bacterium]